MKTPPGFSCYVRNRRRLDDDLKSPRLCPDLCEPDILVVEVDSVLFRNCYILPESSRSDWTAWSDKSPWDSFFDNTLACLQFNLPLISAGDFNARTGDLSPDPVSFFRDSSDKTISPRGRALVNLCQEHDFLLLNGCTSIPGSHSSTTSFQKRKGTDSRYFLVETVIDYFLVPSLLFPFCTSFLVHPETKWSNHAPLLLDIITPSPAPASVPYKHAQ
ncbi:hypothetical protein EV360DRAFT_89702 [Lentinula raphanica]|nr:hypothetical protein EV360DRAFT_89702 [Lentinula raphanica]